MDGFRTHFDYLVHHLYLLHGVDCTYVRGPTTWSVRLIPHLDDQFQIISRKMSMAGIKVIFRSLVSTTVASLTDKTAQATFVTPCLGDRIIFNSETYSVCKGDDDRAWRYLNDRRSQIEITAQLSSRPESH